MKRAKLSWFSGLSENAARFGILVSLVILPSCSRAAVEHDGAFASGGGDSNVGVYSIQDAFGAGLAGGDAFAPDTEDRAGWIASIVHAPIIRNLAPDLVERVDVPIVFTYSTLLNETDPVDSDSDALTIEIDNLAGALDQGGAPSQTLSIRPGESFTWTPPAVTTGLRDIFLIRVSDGALRSDSVKASLENGNQPPTLAMVSALPGAVESMPFSVSHATLAAAADEDDPDMGAVIAFRIESVDSGTLSVAPGFVLGPGQSIVWTPPNGAFGAALPAFSVVAIDEFLAASSPAVPVTVDVMQGGSILNIVKTDAVRREGDSGTTLFEFEIRRTGSVAGQVSVSFEVQPVAPPTIDAADFPGGVFPSGVVVLPPMVAVAALSIPVAGDSIPESSEQFQVVLSNPSATAVIGMGQAIGVILDDDIQPVRIVVADRGPPVFNGAVHVVDVADLSQTPVTTELVDPYDVCIDAAGNFIVIDYETIISSKGRGTQGLYRVDKVTGAVTLITTGGDFSVPVGVVVEADGNILVVDQAAFGLQGAVFRVDPNGALPAAQQTLARGGVPGAHLYYPVGMALAPVGAPNAGDIFIADIGNIGGATSQRDAPPRKIIRVDPVSGAQSIAFEDRVSDPASQLRYPVGMDVEAATGDLFIADAWARKVFRLTQAGELTVVSAVSTFVQPTHLAMHQASRRLYVTDAKNRAGIGQRRIYRIDPAAPADGNAEIVALDGFLQEPRGLCVLP